MNERTNLIGIAGSRRALARLRCKWEGNNVWRS